MSVRFGKSTLGRKIEVKNCNHEYLSGFDHRDLIQILSY